MTTWVTLFSPSELFLQSPAIVFLELECLKVWQFDDIRPISRGGGPTQPTVGGQGVMPYIYSA